HAQSSYQQGSNGSAGYWYVSGYTYTVDLCLALCDGPIYGIGQVWQGSNAFIFAPGSPNPEDWPLNYWGTNNSKGPAVGGITLFTGSSGQTAWSYLTTKFPTYALDYQGLAYLGAAAFNL